MTPQLPKAATSIARKTPYLKQLIQQRDRLRAKVDRLLSEQRQRSAMLPPNHPQVAYEPDLIPPFELMRREGVQVLEEWFRWGEEWSVLLRVLGGLAANSRVLEIGCGLGRIAFPLRYILSPDGSYDGFDYCLEKIVFLKETFQRSYANFRFVWGNVRHHFDNPDGCTGAAEYQFPYADESVDLVFSTSALTHSLPEVALNYLRQSARVLQADGRCLFGCLVLDYYQADRTRPTAFARPDFSFEHFYGEYGDALAIGVPDSPTPMTAYRTDLIENLCAQSGLKLCQDPIPGLWSGSTPNWIGTYDLVLLEKLG